MAKPKKEIKASINKAKDVEVVQPKFRRVPEEVISATIETMVNSICKIKTLHEVSMLIQALQQSKKIE